MGLVSNKLKVLLQFHCMDTWSVNSFPLIRSHILTRNIVAPFDNANSNSFGVCTSTSASVPMMVQASSSTSKSPPTTATMSSTPVAPFCKAWAI